MSSVDAPARGRPEAAGAVWRWRERDAEARAAAARLRRSGVVRGVVGLGVAALLAAWPHRFVAAGIVASLASLTLALAVLSPSRGYAALSRGVDRVAGLVGRVLTFALLAPVFYLFFAPFGLLARRGARDRLHRRFDAAAPSYWTKRAPAPPDALDKPY